jgi:hypothetical protein
MQPKIKSDGFVQNKKDQKVVHLCIHSPKSVGFVQLTHAFVED